MLSRRLSLILALLLVVVFAGACDELLPQDEEDTGNLDALVGTWVTTQHVITNNANTSQQVDLYAAGGRTTLVIEADGDFSVAFVDSSGSWSDSGTVEADDTTLTLTTNTETMTMSYLMVGEILTITYTNSSFDFNDDGTDETATEVMVFQHPEDSGDLDLSDLAGSFKATHFVWSDPSGVHGSEDLIAMGGFFTLKLDVAGNTTVVMGFPGDEGGAQVQTGTSTLVSGGDSLFVDFPGTEGDGTSALQVVGTDITLTRSDVTYNFGGDTELPAVVTINLVPITELSLTSLAGYYSLTSFVLKNPDNAAQSFSETPDIASTIEIGAGGSFTIIHLSRPDEDDTTGVETETAAMSVVGNILILDFTDEDEDTVLQATVDGSTVNLRGMGESYDWDNDNVDDPAYVEITIEMITPGVVSDYAGSWTATAWTYTGDGVGETFDMVANHAMATMVAESDGSFQMLMAGPCDSFEIQSGTTALFGDLLMVTIVGEPGTQYMWSDVSGSTWTIRKPDHWDFSQMGYDDEGAVLEIVFSSTTPATIGDFTGTWMASQFLLTSIDNPADTYDMVGEGGSFSIDIASDGTMSFSIAFPGESVDNGTGTVEIFGDMVIITDNADGWKSAFQYTLGTGTFSLFSNDDSHDFNEDNEDECATLSITLVPPSR